LKRNRNEVLEELEEELEEENVIDGRERINITE
jgi:hypothetical protein